MQLPLSLIPQTGNDCYYFWLALQGLARMFVTVGMCEQAVAAYTKVSLLFRQMPRKEWSMAGSPIL